ncbi:MAG: NirA family protein, partial [Lacipirellulaceae bacterium]
MSVDENFSEEQQNYLQGFALGADVARKIRNLPVISGSASSGTSISVGGSVAVSVSDVVRRPEQRHYDAQDRQTDAGGKLCAEEQAKREKNPLDMWDEMQARARSGEFPKGTDVFLQKFHGLFYVAPAQDSYMCRMRFPGGDLRSYQLRGL